MFKILYILFLLTIVKVTYGNEEDIFEPWYDDYVLIINRYQESQFLNGTVSVEKLKELVNLKNSIPWFTGENKVFVMSPGWSSNSKKILKNLDQGRPYKYIDEMFIYKNESSMKNKNRDFYNSGFIEENALEQQLLVCDSINYFAIIRKDELCNGKCIGVPNDGTKSCLLRIEITEENIPWKQDLEVLQTPLVE